MRFTVSVLAGLAALAATPALALTKAQLDCPVERVDPAFAERLSLVMLGEGKGGEHELDGMLGTIVEMSDACAKDTGIAEDKGDAYFRYVLAAIPRSVFIRQIAASGLHVRTIDDVLDFGPGRSNPVIESVSDAQAEAIISREETLGVDITVVPQSAWTKVGGYASATSLMYGALRTLP